ncbi:MULTISPECIES: GNAT family N-acetyltransferase [Brucella]|jgi:RimJ/RimL family protein N-acetyltransferase|uniref:GNAT family N-acetyltransferase n=1 Tax=Brucella TaxID=234 RepID=UPI00045082E2|nr:MULTISPECIES: GNAT family N-acetyltransferase [Brucella/Ochrobactrum group]MCR5943801.1 GNAT family N-acetyltransferase [Ochrobactrum sp. XJ1]EXL05000.1 GCN5 family acetyltransferase [Brucella anthropi]MBA8862622.1 RimJ/RimL family protein N-acetyltransferase [Brucella anthropi]MDG9793203.1 GNAT family N-acetyltransferase [Brucella anthropi]MDH0583063.1 GNAT family N-acetyltransferase [Brucella anthropi]
MKHCSVPNDAAPVLETERLIMSGHEAEDFGRLADIWAEPSVVEHISGKPSTLRESWMRLLAFKGLWPLLGFGYWAVREKATNLYVGDLGFADFHRDVDPSLRGIPEAGWVLSPSSRGKGYASEALSAALAWLEAQNRFERSVCLISSDNLASIRVAEKAGYSDGKTVLMNGSETLCFSRALKGCDR